MAWRSLTLIWLALSVLALNSSAQQPSPSNPKPPVQVNPKDGEAYVWIPPGKFQMGCSPGDNECLASELHRHEVEITTGFWLGQTEVTVGAWRRYRLATRKKPLPTSGTDGRSIWNDVSPDNYPVVLVAWKDAGDFCQWVGGRLPTEAEWEYAARAGEESKRYGDTDEIAWFANNSGGAYVDFAAFPLKGPTYRGVIVGNDTRAHPVAQKKPNAWGLHDMFGNVAEWVQDWYYWSYYTDKPVKDPRGPRSGATRVKRGASWFDAVSDVRASLRRSELPDSRSSDIGLRCVATLP